MKLIEPRVLVPLVGALVLAASATWQVIAPIDVVASLIASKPSSAIMKPATAMAAPPLGLRQDFAEIEQRPLFVAGRKRPAVAIALAVAPAQAQSLDKYTVLGIVVAPSHATAILRNANSETLHVHVGEAVEGWTLETIAPTKLVFESGGQHQEMLLKISKSSPSQGPLRTNTGMPR